MTLKLTRNSNGLKIYSYNRIDKTKTQLTFFHVNGALTLKSEQRRLPIEEVKIYLGRMEAIALMSELEVFIHEWPSKNT